jgi:hypothetical protein
MTILITKPESIVRRRFLPIARLVHPDRLIVNLACFIPIVVSQAPVGAWIWAAVAAVCFAGLDSARHVFEAWRDRHEHRLSPSLWNHPVAAGHVGGFLAAIIGLGGLLVGCIAASASPALSFAAVVFLALMMVDRIWLRVRRVGDMMTGVIAINLKIVSAAAVSGATVPAIVLIVVSVMVLALSCLVRASRAGTSACPGPYGHDDRSWLLPAGFTLGIMALGLGSPQLLQRVPRDDLAASAVVMVTLLVVIAWLLAMMERAAGRADDVGGFAFVARDARTWMAAVLVVASWWMLTRSGFFGLGL